MDREAFIAPAPRRPGQPTPETMARLQAAVSKQPRSETGRVQAPLRQQQPQPTMQQEVPAEKRSRINSLINRMTGQPEGGAAQPAQHRVAPAAPQQQRVEPQAAPRRAPQHEADADQERIEIPAFLRRQAN